jgi:LPS O-antigen subunit length determinant protein (WzzB/FepE family)
MKKSTANTQQEKTELEQLSQTELVKLVLGLQKIIQELQENLAIATGKSRTTSQTSSGKYSITHSSAFSIVKGALAASIHWRKWSLSVSNSINSAIRRF